MTSPIPVWERVGSGVGAGYPFHAICQLKGKETVRRGLFLEEMSDISQWSPEVPGTLRSQIPASLFPAQSVSPRESEVVFYSRQLPSIILSPASPFCSVSVLPFSLVEDTMSPFHM